MVYLALLCLRLGLAQSVPFKNLSPDEFHAVAREFAANTLFTDVSGAAAPGPLFSFEVGAVVGVTNVPHVDDLTENASVSRVPNGLAFGALALPVGLTAEVGWLPRLGQPGFALETSALALKWTPSDLWPVLPFDVAVRTQFVKTSLKLEGVVDEVRTQSNFGARVAAAEVRASKNLGILTPFVAAGISQAHADMNASGALVFDPTYTHDQRQATYARAATFAAGVEVHLLILSAGLEYARAFGADRASAKLGFGF